MFDFLEIDLSFSYQLSYDQVKPFLAKRHMVLIFLNVYY